MIRILIGVILLINAFGAFGQRAPRFFKKSDYLTKIDSLRSGFGINKEIPSDYEIATLIALSYYPELSETKINFVFKKLSSTMATRPKLLSTFRRKGKRTYNIYINNINPQVPLDSASFNAQIGVIGHELGHITYYDNKSSFSLIGNAFAYPNLKFRAKFERATDQRNLMHGLFWQSYDFKMFTHSYKGVSEEYKIYKKKIYLSPEEVLEQE